MTQARHCHTCGRRCSRAARGTRIIALLVVVLVLLMG